MRRFAFALVALLALVASPATAQTDPFQLVGFTTNTVLGDAGVLGMSAACTLVALLALVAEFGDMTGVRMCTSVEVMETTAVPAISEPEAWVRPVFQPHTNASTSGIRGR